MTRASTVAFNAEVIEALRTVVDVLVRSDGEKMPGDFKPCTDEAFDRLRRDAALERAQAVLAKVDGGKPRERVYRNRRQEPL